MCEALIFEMFRNWNDTPSWEEQFSGTESVARLTDGLVKIAPETGAYLNEVSRLFHPIDSRQFLTHITVGRSIRSKLETKLLWKELREITRDQEYLGSWSDVVWDYCRWRRPLGDCGGWTTLPCGRVDIILSAILLLDHFIAEMIHISVFFPFVVVTSLPSCLASFVIVLSISVTQ